MSEDSSKREREFQYELAKLQVDYQYYLMLFLGLIAFLLGLIYLLYWFFWLYLFVTDIGIVAVFLFVVGRVKEIRFEEIKEEFKLFVRTETQELESS
jgi:Flp pilus assembly protein TadB